MSAERAAALSWVTQQLDVPRETIDKLDALVAELIAENAAQNLISAASIPHIWSRHILDSAQLVATDKASGSWLDLGTGAGFPGLVIAILRPEPITLVDERRRRTDFLSRVVEQLGLIDCLVVHGRAETIPAERFDVISARAFAPLERLLAIGSRFADAETLWLLPKGRSARAELEAARRTWQGDFTLVPSITDPDASIIVARKVRAARETKAR